MVLTPDEQIIDAEIKTQSLHLKFDEQLIEMAQSHAAKIPQVENDLDKGLNFSDVIRWELKESGLLSVEIEAEVVQQITYYQWKKAQLIKIVSLIESEQAFRKDGKVIRKPIGTVYYIDSDNGNDTTNDGTSATKTNGDGPWATLDKFTENARSAGDKAILRRGMTNRYDNASDLQFSSSGTIDNPIIITADNANAFGDDVDLSATATATLTFGSKTITFSADISGVCAAGDWIYVAAEDADEFAYEVDSVSTVTVTLFLPYKGVQAGSGKTMTNMQSPPIWNTAAGNFQWNFDGDNYWKVQGIHIRGLDTNGNVGIDTCTGHAFYDCIFEGSGGSSTGINGNDDATECLIKKCRILDHLSGLVSVSSSGLARWIVLDSLVDLNSVGSSRGIKAFSGSALVIDSEFKGADAGDIGFSNFLQFGSVEVLLRNTILSSAVEIHFHQISAFCRAMIEDHDGALNDTRQLTYLSSAQGTPTIQSEDMKVRSGGSAISEKITPSTELSTNWEFSRLLLFELPIYATTSSKTYTVYFASDTTTEWTSNPTAGELWIELEYWGHASNNFRRITKSTGTVDFTTDTDFDQTLAVTIAPAQAGVAYLRCYYAKTKEAAKTNIFYVDPQIAIS